MRGGENREGGERERREGGKVGRKKKRNHSVHQYYVIMTSYSFCSDVIVQIVDGRNPLLFRCEDLVSPIPIIYWNPGSGVELKWWN